MDEAAEHQAFVHRLRSTIQSRDYQEAKALCAAHEAEHRTMKEIQLHELSNIHRLERNRLHAAKQMAVERSQSAGHQVIKTKEEELGTRQRNVQSAHDDRLSVYSTLLREKEMRRPIVYSTVTNTLRHSEAHLGRLKMFDDASVAKSKLLRREALEHALTIKERERKIRDCVEMKRMQFLDEERTLYTRMKGELQVQKGHLLTQVQRVASTYDHLEKDMERAHYRQAMECRKTTTVDLKRALESGTGQMSRTVRGSTMLRKIKGNRFTIPSLCELYGGLLDEKSNHSPPSLRPLTSAS